MPKIRCQGCEAVLNAPEQARGKVIACPKCGTKLKVPAGPATTPQATKSPGKPAVKKKPAAEQDFDFGSLDLDRLQSTNQEGSQVCPYCAAERDPEDPVCRSCGMNVQTGVMDKNEQRRRSLKGPDPQLFFKNAWKESWEFMWENVGMAMRSNMFWWTFITLNAICSYMWLVYCQRVPTKTFWALLTIMTASGPPGWFLFVVLKVISASTARESFRPDRVHFDFFQAVAGGTRTVFWPLVVIGPLLPLCLAFYGYLKLSGSPLAENYMFLAGTFAALQILPILTLPIALVHMTARHTYKAWILWELLLILVKNVGAVLYLIVISVIVFLPTFAVAGGIFYLIGSTNPMVSPLIVGEPKGEEFTPGLTGNIALWVMKLLEMGTDQKGFTYIAFKGLFNMAATAIVMLPIAYSAGLPAMFLMKAIGAFGYYRNRLLDLVPRMLPGTPATFWVRYLAHTVDLLFMPLTGFLVTSNAKAIMGFWVGIAFSVLIWFFSPDMRPIVVFGLPIYISWMYWSVQESSQLKSTMGKDTFGLIVVQENENALTIKQATVKWFLRVLWTFSFGLPFVLSAFREDKKALHDLVTGTKVVFKGDR